MSVSKVACFCLASLLVLSDRATAHDDGPDRGALAIGVRSNARPFSYRLQGIVDSDATRGPLSHAGYTGYMVRICDAALAEMLVDTVESERLSLDEVRIYDIDTGLWHGQDEEEGHVRPEDPAGDRFAKLGKEFDILCDPATLTNARRDMLVSPPVFLTGISYLTLKNRSMPSSACGVKDTPLPEKPKEGAAATPPEGQSLSTKEEDKRALIGLVTGTTSKDRGIQALIDAREMPRFEDVLIKELKDPTSPCSEPQKPAQAASVHSDVKQQEDEKKKERVLVQTYPSHKEAANAFCLGKAFHVYVGDLEIIRSYANAIPGCKFDNGVVTYTNDRYAVFGMAIGSVRPDNNTRRADINDLLESRQLLRDTTRELLVARFFSILTQKVIFNPSVLDKAYEDTFSGQQRSRKLQIFYWSIRGERLPELPSDSGSPSEEIQKQTD